MGEFEGGPDKMLMEAEGGARQYRQVEVAEIVACAGGDVVDARPTGKLEWQVLHACGCWTWLVANYCTGCGVKMEPGWRQDRQVN